jgi:hypothetical protein
MKTSSRSARSSAYSSENSSTQTEKFEYMVLWPVACFDRLLVMHVGLALPGLEAVTPIQGRVQGPAMMRCDPGFLLLLATVSCMSDLERPLPVSSCQLHGADPSAPV